MISVQMLPAGVGDALWVQWADGRHRMLIDGGPKHTYQNVFDQVQALPDADRKLDLLVVTHIDSDHLEGTVRLLQDWRAPALKIDDIWFNGLRHLPGAEDMLGPDQGEMMQALVTIQKLSWNQKFAGGPVVVPADATCPSFELPGDAKITLLSPGPAELASLRRVWSIVLRRLGIRSDVRAALERLAGRRDLRGLLGDVRDLLGRQEVDSSEANGSSIAFLFEQDGHSVLFSGDSHSDVLARGLRKLLVERGLRRLSVDAFKVPHHGSVNNVSVDLLSLIDTSRFLFSTNGKKYGHPDAETIGRVLDSAENPQLIFNYRSPTTTPWDGVSGCTAVYPDGVSAGVTVEV